MSADIFRRVVIAAHYARTHGGLLDDAVLHITAPDHAAAKEIADALVPEVGCSSIRDTAYGCLPGGVISLSHDGATSVQVGYSAESADEFDDGEPSSETLADDLRGDVA